MKNLCSLLLIALLTACSSTLPVTDFKTHHPLNNLNGTYLQNYGDLAWTIPTIFRDTTLRKDIINNVDIRFNGKDSITLTWLNMDTVLRKDHYKGEIKDNYFEIKLKWKTLIAFPFFIDYQRDRLRLGLTEDNHLITHYWHDNTGGIFLLLGGYDAEYKKIYERLSQRSARAWYNFVTTPDAQGNFKGVTDNKWALLDSSSNRLTGYEYDYIDYYDSDMDGYRITMQAGEDEELMGYIDTQGKVIIPAQYQSIQDTEIPGIKKVYQHGYHNYGLFESHHATHFGFITRERVICPPVLSQVESEFKRYNKKGLDPQSKYCKVVYNNKSYLLGLDGYLYPYSSFLGSKKIKADKRIKVGYKWEE